MISFIVQYTDKSTLERIFDGPIFQSEEEALLKKEELEEQGHLDVIIESDNDIQLDRE
ncbi:hypothetical protein [Metabacillus arenae]|uniref:Uncharacterized protein n=1 Tax=Metabacillus arenae TaxID=2771434 RepID=A0A926RVX7_9BACI|nr:hypothetical protein [Metabacillus arenae]MBD1378965.1 hypothetical protein [Metabacillus arenae]